MNLYTIANDYQSLLDSVIDPETGEINEGAIQKLDGLSENLKEKGIAIAAFIRNIEADRKAIKEERDRLAKRESTLANRVTWMNEYLKTNMERCGVTEIPSPYFAIKLKKCPVSVDISDEDAIPELYRRRQEVITIDKTRIKKDIQDGQFIPGAELKQGIRLDIR